MGGGGFIISEAMVNSVFILRIYSIIRCKMNQSMGSGVWELIIFMIACTDLILELCIYGVKALMRLAKKVIKAPNRINPNQS